MPPPSQGLAPPPRRSSGSAPAVGMRVEGVLGTDGHRDLRRSKERAGGHRRIQIDMGVQLGVTKGHRDVDSNGVHWSIRT